jgi:large subunit ribosomal protein L24
MVLRLKIKKGDKVVVISGRDKGKTGEVIKMYPREMRAIVQGVHRVKRHPRQSQANPQGGIIEKEGAIHLSNIAHVDPKSGKPTRVGFKFLKDGKKVRFAKKSGEVIDK